MAFQKGKSGNPHGRPRGTTYATKLRKEIAKHAPEIIQNLLESANNGDVQASKILLDRVCPPLKSQNVSTKLPLDAESLSKQGEQILGLMIGGQLPVNDAIGLINALSSLAKLQEFDDLVGRIEKLEQQL